MLGARQLKKMVLYRQLLIFTSFLTSLSLTAQTNEWQIFDTSSPVGTNSITDIEIDPLTGDVWVCGSSASGANPNGISRYSNGTWTNYNTSNSTLPSNYFNCISIEGAYLWLGRDGSTGLVKFCPSTNSCTVYNLYNIVGTTNYLGASVQDIAIDKNGTKWLGTLKGILKFDNLNWTQYNSLNSPMPSDKVYHTLIYDSIQDVIWFGLYEGGLGKFDGTNFTFYDPSPAGNPGIFDHINGITIDQNGDIWSAGIGAITHWDKNTMQVIQQYGPNDGMTDGYWWDIKFDLNNEIWVGTDLIGSLNHFDGNSWNYYNATNSGMPYGHNGDIDNQVPRIAIDQNDNKWIATCFGGVAVYRKGGLILSTENVSMNVDHDIQIYPNPYSYSTIITTKIELKNAEIAIYDVLGQKIKEEKNIFGQKITIDRDNLIDGIYFYKLKQNNEIIATGKIIAE